MSADLFSALIGKAQLDGTFIIEAGRWIKRHNDGDAEVMAKAECEALILNRHQKTLRLEHNNQHYLITSGLPSPETEVAGLRSISTTPGLFILARQELSLDIIASPAEIRDAIGDFHRNVEGYDGHDLTSISSLFSHINCFIIDPSYNFFMSIERATGSYASRAYGRGPLMLEEATLSQFTSTFEAGEDSIPFYLILQGLLSFSWANLFMDLYRCIEHLYAAPRLSTLIDKLGVTISIHDTADLLERVIAWRPKEDESLNFILRDCSELSVAQFLSALSIEAPSEKQQIIDTASRVLYKLRNSLVHYRPSSDKVNISDSCWNTIIRSMLDFIA